MTDREQLDEIRWMHQRSAQYIARLTPEQAQQLARHDMQAHSRQTQQFERANLRNEMTMRARANPHYKAVIDQVAMARLAAALQRSRKAESEPRTAGDVKESCS